MTDLVEDHPVPRDGPMACPTCGRPNIDHVKVTAPDWPDPHRGRFAGWSAFDQEYHLRTVHLLAEVNFPSGLPSSRSIRVAVHDDAHDPPSQADPDPDRLAGRIDLAGKMGDELFDEYEEALEEWSATPWWRVVSRRRRLHRWQALLEAASLFYRHRRSLVRRQRKALQVES